MVYKYDNQGRYIGMDAQPVTGLQGSPTTLETTTSGTETRFYYDDSYNRVKLVNKTGNVYYFVYDPTADVPAVVYEQSSTNRYVNLREPGGSLVSREKYDSGRRIACYTYHFDGLGSTLVLTDEYGQVSDRYTYDAWGNVTHTYGTTDDNPYQYVGQLGYYTHCRVPGRSCA